MSNSESNFGGGWKSSNSTEKSLKSHLNNICNFPQNFSLFLDCFEKNTFNANESFAKVMVNDQEIDLDKLSPQLYDIWYSKFYVLNHSFANENESIEIEYNKNEHLKYFIRKTVYSILTFETLNMRFIIEGVK